MPTHSLILAELIGIYMGDGNLGKYPRCHYLRIYFNPNQKQYISYVKELLTTQFKKVPYERFRPDSGKIGVVYLEISKKNLDKYLGFPTGSKIKNKIKIPKWIWGNKKYLINCIRGIFDTDGSLYITGKKYRIVNFCSHNTELLEDIYNALVVLGFNPYSRQAGIELGRISEVKRFFELVRPKNSNHYRFDYLPR